MTELPHTRDALLELPGIGPYTAGAIASIACNERVCAVDGNVLRVFSRILCSEEDISVASAKKKIEQSMTAYLPDAAQISAFNQALMDLGAMVCLPKGEPRCAQCPVQTECAAFACGMQTQLPVRTAKKPRRIEEHTVLIYACQQRLRLIRRPSKGLLSGLYGFEMTEERLSEEAVKQAHPDERVVALGHHVHVFTHVEWHMDAFLIETKTADASYHSPQEIDRRYALPTAFRPFYQAALRCMKEMGHIYEK